MSETEDVLIDENTLIDVLFMVYVAGYMCGAQDHSNKKIPVIKFSRMRENGQKAIRSALKAIEEDNVPHYADLRIERGEFDGE